MLRRQLETRVRNPPNWSLLRRTITVHALGGVPEGPDRESGVVPAAVPEDAPFAAMAARRAATAGDGVLFRERMRTDDDAVVLTLGAEVRSMDRFLADSAHPITITGDVDVRSVVRGAATEGTLSLFPDAGSVAMAYALRFQDESGRAWELSGTKTVRSRIPTGLLHDLTTLDTSIRPLDGSRPATHHVLSIQLPDLVRLGTSLRGQGFTRARRVRALARFTGFFARAALRPPAPGLGHPRESEAQSVTPTAVSSSRMASPKSRC